MIATADAATELLSVARGLDVWTTLAWFDTRLRYRRTVIGPFWVTLSTGIMVLAIGLVYGQIFGTPAGLGAAGYMAYFAVGTIVWSFISAVINEACSVFCRSSALIKALPTPLLLYVFRMMARNVVLLAHNVIVILLLWIVLRWEIGWSVLLAVPGLVLLAVALFGMVVAFGVLGARFRDLEQIVGTLLQLMFLITPILWLPSAIRQTRSALLLDLNPAYYMIEIVRAPLLGESVEPRIWFVASFITMVSILCGLFLYGRFRHRLSYWL